MAKQRTRKPVSVQSETSNLENTLMDQNIHNSEPVGDESTLVDVNPDAQSEPAVNAEPETSGEPTLGDYLSRFMAPSNVRTKPGKKSASVKIDNTRQLPSVNVVDHEYGFVAILHDEPSTMPDDWQSVDGGIQTSWLAGMECVAPLVTLSESGLDLAGFSVCLKRPDGFNADDFLRLCSLCSNHRTALELLGGQTVMDTRNLPYGTPETAFNPSGFLTISGENITFNFLGSINPIDNCARLQLCLGILVKSLGQRAKFRPDSDPLFRSPIRPFPADYVPYHDDGTPIQSVKRLIDTRLKWQNTKNPVGILDPQFLSKSGDEINVRRQLLALVASNAEPTEPNAD